MDTNDLIEAKRKMEIQIHEAVSEFTNKTGMTVDDVDIQTIRNMTKTLGYIVKTTVIIP